jgi:hypothetical protein
MFRFYIAVCNNHSVYYVSNSSKENLIATTAMSRQWLVNDVMSRPCPRDAIALSNVLCVYTQYIHVVCALYSVTASSYCRVVSLNWALPTFV